jgi:hypothetical protein
MTREELKMASKKEMGVIMMKEGIEVFKEVNKDVFVDVASPLIVTLLPVLFGCCCQSIMYAYYMKRLDAVIAGLEALRQSDARIKRFNLSE